MSLQTEFDNNKKDFYNATERVLVIKRESDKRTLNTDKINEYVERILSAYNAFVAATDTNWSQYNEESKGTITKSFRESYNPRLIESLHFLGFHVQLPAKASTIDKDSLTVWQEEEARGGTEMKWMVQ